MQTYPKCSFFQLLSVLLLFWWSSTAAQAQYQSLDSALTYLARTGQFSGVVLIADNGKMVYQKATGTEGLNLRPSFDTESAFNLASVSKQFMATMILMLQEERKLRLSDDVRQHLPAFPYTGITIKHLLTHTSGLPEYFDLAQRYMGSSDTLSNESMLELLAQHRPSLRFSTGSRWEYSNTGYVLLGSIIQKAAQEPIELYFKRKIIEPYGLQHTFIYYHNMLHRPTKERVLGFERANGQLIANDLIRIDGVIGDGNVYASASDLLRWSQAYFGGKVLSEASFQEAISPVRLSDGSQYPYGFGWGLSADGLVISHTGSWVGFRTLLWHDRRQKRTVVVLTNGSDGLAVRNVQAWLDAKPMVLPRTQLIRNVQVIDGTGTPARRVSVRIKGERIAEVGDLKAFEQEDVIDGGGKVLAPGFIDSHSHLTNSVSERPEMIPALSQGITTVVLGQDGGSEPLDSLAASIKRRPVATNVASYTGHTTLRRAAMGSNLFRQSTAQELAKMKELLAHEMQQGSLGLATGLEYESAFFSNRAEVLALAKVVADSGGRYLSHIRSEDINIEDALDEIIEIGRLAKLPVQISHFKIAMKSKWGQAQRLLAQLQQARSQGIDITADVYPYTFWLSTLRILFPKRDYRNSQSAEFACRELFDPNGSVLIAFAPNPAYVGKTLGEVATLRREPAAITLMYLIDEAERFDQTDGGRTEGIMGLSMSEPDVATLMAWPHSNICTDGSEGNHPRGHGAFTRVLGRYVREQQLMPLETAIHKMTALTAEHMGLAERGVIAAGYFADLVLFDAATVQDNATLQNPTALSSGIERVWVNGRVVYQNQQSTKQYSGRLLRRN